MGNQLVKERAAQIPVGDTPQDIAKRAQLFNQMDMNGNNYLSLAEVDKAVRDILKIPQLFDAKPVMIRAFNASLKKINKPSPHNQDYVTKATFKFLLIYLRLYYELWIDFDKIDVDDERRISEKQFINGSHILTEGWHLKIEDSKATFKTLLQKYNAKNFLTFTDFCDYVISERLKQHANLDSHDSF